MNRLSGLFDKDRIFLWGGRQSPRPKGRSTYEGRSTLFYPKGRSNWIQAVAEHLRDRNNSKACCFTLPSITSFCKLIK
ncbi:MAG: hypothetical protein WCF82_15310, partial [Microcoleus sp.]